MRLETHISLYTAEKKQITDKLESGDIEGAFMVLLEKLCDRLDKIEGNFKEVEGLPIED
jgi:hypothetical protein